MLLTIKNRKSGKMLLQNDYQDRFIFRMIAIYAGNRVAKQFRQRIYQTVVTRTYIVSVDLID